MREPDTEGVTKFHLDFAPSAAPPLELVAPLNAWRTILHRLGLISQDPRRYGGVGFGNVSRRGSAGTGAGPAPLFLVSGTQTGGLAEVTEQHYCWVHGYDLRANTLRASGPIPPSSEAMTHASVYEADDSVHCVLHVHCPEIWNRAQVLELPSIDESVAYGTPEMAEAVAELVGRRSPGVLVMRGHEDGVIAYGRSVDATALRLIRLFARALQSPSP